MAFDRFMIGPFNSGLQTDMRKFLIPEDAFSTLQNAYVFRGRVRKRFGSTLMDPNVNNSRLRVMVGTTNGAGVLAGIVPGAVGAVGQAFSIGNSFYTVYNSGAGANAMLDSGTPATTTKTFNLASGAYNFVGAPINTAVYWYPALPVMGLTQYEVNQINNHPSYAFDQRFAYLYVGGSGWNRSSSALGPIWHGDNTDFFWTTNWQGIPQGGGIEIPALFVTNFQVTNPDGATVATDDPIWYGYAAAGGVAISTWVPMSASDAVSVYVNGIYFLPNGGARINSPFVQTAKIIVPFKDRLLLLNTIENDNSATHGVGTNTNYVNRCRYSWNGSPFATNAWYEPGQSDNTGVALTGSAAGGDYIDASTDEQIVSAEFIRDRLIVYFERSTWEIIYTQSEVTPFRWQKINTELGSQSTFSTVPFDTAVLTIGQSGIHQCSGANVSRIDEKIPDEIFDNFEVKNNATLRTCGIRDYYTELVYWAFVQASDNNSIGNTFPNQVLVYNYKTGSWALNDDTITSFGYFEQSTDTTWASSAPATWATYSGSWSSSFGNAQERQIIAGTPEGFIFIINDDSNSNAQAMQITQVAYASGIMTLTIYNHNFSDGDFINIFNLNGITISDPTTPIFKVSYIDVNNISIAYLVATGVYVGGGTASRVSNIQIETKQWNPYLDKDRNFFLQRIDFIVANTQLDTTTPGQGQITVDYYPSSSDQSMLQAGNATGAIIGTGILETTPYNPIYYPLEATQDRLTHPLYFQTTGNVIELYMFLSDTQMVNPLISLTKFELEAMILYTSPTDYRMQ